jgi:rubrerythrin
VTQTYFNDLEALEIAVRIEQRGQSFYTQATALATTADTKAMLEELAIQEGQHADTFQEIYNELSVKEREFDDLYLYEPEVAAYLRAMAQSSIFPTDDRLKEIMEEVTDIKEVLRIGVQAEKDSILFYTEMIINAKHVDAKDAFRRLVKEEKKHLIDLQTKLNEYKNL